MLAFPRAEVISPVPREVWDCVYLSDPHAIPSQSARWNNAACEQWGWRDASRLYLIGERRVVMPLVKMGIGPFSAHLSPRRGWGYGGLIADGGVRAADVEVVSLDLDKLRVSSLWVRPNPLQAPQWCGFAAAPVRESRISHFVDISCGADAAWERLGSSAKKGVKTAGKAGVRIETASGKTLLDVFFQLTYLARADWASRQGEPVYLGQLRGRLRDSRRKWECIASHLGSDFQVSVAWHEDTPVSAGIVLAGRNAHGVRAAMHPDHRKLGASHLLNWTVLKNACAAGAGWFCMGESANAGVVAFKESFGAKPFQFNEFKYETIPLSRGIDLIGAAYKSVIGFRQEEFKQKIRPEHGETL
jgi:hypothetical protein